ncbi:MAG: hypothetical protein KDA28_16440, partial [Phycisphaerales bacterium]|nr:hypothetical protein [Phycisphaerales bacterium]
MGPMFTSCRRLALATALCLLAACGSEAGPTSGEDTGSLLDTGEGSGDAGAGGSDTGADSGSDAGSDAADGTDVSDDPDAADAVTAEARCSDGIDNDGDGAVDCADADC